MAIHKYSPAFRRRCLHCASTDALAFTSQRPNNEALVMKVKNQFKKNIFAKKNLTRPS